MHEQVAGHWSFIIEVEASCAATESASVTAECSTQLVAVSKSGLRGDVDQMGQQLYEQQDQTFRVPKDWDNMGKTSFLIVRICGLVSMWRLYRSCVLVIR